jgi:hypothetical protein
VHVLFPPDIEGWGFWGVERFDHISPETGEAKWFDLFKHEIEWPEEACSAAFFAHAQPASTVDEPDEDNNSSRPTLYRGDLLPPCRLGFPDTITIKDGEGRSWSLQQFDTFTFSDREPFTISFDLENCCGRTVRPELQVVYAWDWSGADRDAYTLVERNEKVLEPGQEENIRYRNIRPLRYKKYEEEYKPLAIFMYQDPGYVDIFVIQAKTQYVKIVGDGCGSSMRTRP